MKATHFSRVFNGCWLYYVSSYISKSGEAEYAPNKKSALKLIDKAKAKEFDVKL